MRPQPLVHPVRSHHATARETRACQTHGDFEAVQWSLDPVPQLRVGDKELPPFLQPFWSACPACDAEKQREADFKDQEIRGGITERQRLAALRKAAAGIPPRYSEASIWNWQHGIDQQRRCWDWVRDYANDFASAIESGRCAIFVGSTGTGKTHLAIGLLQHVLEKGGTGLYVTVMTMLGRIKDTFNKSAVETEAKVIEAYRSVDLLVIDEVGKSVDSNYEHSQFFRILDLRYQDMKPTIVVSNLKPSDLRAFLGEAVADRMTEAGGRVLMFDWASQRSTKRLAKPEGDE
jgi:DNA replication protein DnaC